MFCVLFVLVLVCSVLVCVLVCVARAVRLVCLCVFVLWVGVVCVRACVSVCGQSAGPIRAAKLSPVKNRGQMCTVTSA